MSTFIAELKGSSPFGELVEIHVKEVDRELPVEVAKLKFPVFRRREVSRKFFLVVFVKGTVVVDTFVHAEMFSVFDRLECMVAVRALEF